MAAPDGRDRCRQKPGEMQRCMYEYRREMTEIVGNSLHDNADGGLKTVLLDQSVSLFNVESGKCCLIRFRYRGISPPTVNATRSGGLFLQAISSGYQSQTDGRLPGCH